MNCREAAVDRAATMLAGAYWRGRLFGLDVDQTALELCINALASAQRDQWVTAASVVVGDTDYEAEIKRLRTLCGEAAFRGNFGPDDKSLEDELIEERRKTKYGR